MTRSTSSVRGRSGTSPASIEALAATPDAQIRSRQRVRDLAEVYTAEREVKAMVDLVAEEAAATTSRFLEPACGNGNFLVEILARKLRTVAAQRTKTAAFELNTLLAVASIYGVDICAENVKEARERLFVAVVDHYSTRHNTLLRAPYFDDAVHAVLATNIVKGNFLDPGDLCFTEYKKTSRNKVARKEFRLVDLYSLPGQLPMPPVPIQVFPPVPYQELGRV